MKLKLSRYLYFKEDGEQVHVVNLLNETFFTLEKSKANMLVSGDINFLEKEDPKLLNTLKKVDIVIPYELNQIDLIRINNRANIFDNRSYRLTINPTLECNFKCWYCYEKHPQGKISESLMSAIINHIKKKIEIERISSLQLDWFGGEPLLYFDEVMYPLLVQIKKIADENKVLFTSSATTNGFLIDEEKVRKFEEVGLNSFQITLDGNKKQHDKIRFTSKKEGSFDQIIKNINLLAQIKKVDIALRINYIEKTLINIESIIPELSMQAKAKVTVKFQQVWQDSAKKQVCAEECENKFVNLGLKVDQSRFNRNGYVCYADKLQQALINYDGKVFKCTARDFTSYPEDGILLNSGDIEWNTLSMIKRFGKATFENKHCLACNLLPVCFGPCSQKMIEFNKKDNFKQICSKGGIIKIINREIDRLK